MKAKSIKYKSSLGYNGNIFEGDKVIIRWGQNRPRCFSLKDEINGEIGSIESNSDSLVVFVFDLPKKEFYPKPYLISRNYADANNLQYKYCGKYIYWISINPSITCSFIWKKINIVKTTKPLISFDFKKHRDIIYGNIIKNENKSLPPIDKRPFEFL